MVKSMACVIALLFSFSQALAAGKNGGADHFKKLLMDAVMECGTATKYTVKAYQIESKRQIDRVQFTVRGHLLLTNGSWTKEERFWVAFNQKYGEWRAEVMIWGYGLSEMQKNGCEGVFVEQNDFRLNKSDIPVPVDPTGW